MDTLPSEELLLYRNLSSHFRRTLTSEVCRDGYRHLRKPNYQGKKAEAWPDMKFRLNILARPGEEGHDSHRRLQCGMDELIIVLYGMFPSSSHLSGFHLFPDFGRVIVPNDIHNYIPVPGTIGEALADNRVSSGIRASLSSGSYGQFVSLMAITIDKTLEELKHGARFAGENRLWNSLQHWNVTKLPPD